MTDRRVLGGLFGAGVLPSRIQKVVRRDARRIQESKPGGGGAARRAGLKESLIGLPETFHERSPPALGILLVPHRTPLFLPQSERHLLGFAIILAFCTLVGMPGVGDGIDLFDRVCRRMLAKSTANDDVIVAGLCWCQ